MNKSQCTSLCPSMVFDAVCTETAPLGWGVGVMKQVIELCSVSVYLSVLVMKMFTSGSAAVLLFFMYARLVLDIFDMCFKAIFSFTQT